MEVSVPSLAWGPFRSLVAPFPRGMSGFILAACFFLLTFLLSSFHLSPLTWTLLWGGCALWGSLFLGDKVGYWVLAAVSFCCVGQLWYASLPWTEKVWLLGLSMAWVLDGSLLLLGYTLYRTETEAERAALDQWRLLHQQAEASRISALAAASVKQKELEEEIQRLAQEAEKGRVEYAAERKRISLVEGEIALWVEQKQSWQEELRSLRQHKAEIEESTAEKSRLVREKEEREEAYRTLEAGYRQLEESCQQAQQLHAVQEQEQSQKEKEEREKAYSLLQEAYARLSATYQEMQQQLECMRIESTQAHKERLEAERVAVQLAAAGEQRLQEQEEHTRLQKEKETLERTLKLVEAQHAQLREQFTQKQQTLARTRRELFEKEEHCLAQEREGLLRAPLLSEEEEGWLHAYRALCVQVEEQAEEITHLEGLVT